MAGQNPTLEDSMKMTEEAEESCKLFFVKLKLLLNWLVFSCKNAQEVDPCFTV